MVMNKLQQTVCCCYKH